MQIKRQLLAAITLAIGVHAIGQPTCVSFKSSSSSFPVVQNGKAAQIFTSSDDLGGVHRAAQDLISDIQKVTGVTPHITNVTSSIKTSETPIIIGTLGESSLISAIVNHTKLDVSSIEGQWEAYMSREIKNPLPGISSAYVVIGADKRGSVFAIYDHSEQMGVSPWYWWADVPTTRNSNIFFSSLGCSHGSPTVKYRGVFLNDEQPNLQNWAMEKFTNGTGAALTGSPFNHFFYTKLFELILRLRGNYLWPAQWSSAFAVDDETNQFFATYYGIVMGTSHEEPMTRSIPVEWGLFGQGAWNYSTNSQFIYDFWVNGTERAKPYDWIYTMGMRGDGDLPLSESTNIGLLQQIISDQRQILMNVFNTSDITHIPQVWTLYQEVLGYYVDGLRVPDDVTLLWADDTWGNMLRLPIPDEFNRTGGAGVYYHYDLVGPPRDYKWITSTQISKVFDQMSQAVDRHADRIWILNVGDLKPYEMSIEFFITYGYNASRWSMDNLDSFVSQWALREFDVSSTVADEIVTIVNNVTRFNARRKPELLNGTTFSLTDYREAELVLADWETLANSSTKIYNSLNPSLQPAFFQLVHHAVMASSTLGHLWIYQGMNSLRASQARLSANGLADQVESAFEQDYDLEHEYHTILDGKWDHMMDQTHVQYYYWQQPMANTMPPVSRVQSKKQALPGPMRISPEGSAAAWPGDNPNQCTQGYNCPFPTLTIDPFVPFGNRFVDVGSGGPNTFTFKVSANESWIKLSTSSGTVTSSNPEQRVLISVDWNKVPQGQVGFANVNFVATASGQPSETVPVTIVANHTVPASGFHGFVEGDGGVSIEAAHTSRSTAAKGISWTELPSYGKTVSGLTPWPRTGNNFGNFTPGAGPSVEYDFFTFNTINQGGSVTIHAMVSPTLNNMGPGEPIAFAMQLDGGNVETMYFIPPAAPGTLPPQWNGNDGYVANAIVDVPMTVNATPGSHTLKIFMVEPAVIIQKIIVDTGGVRPSYLGPPESIKV